MRCDAFRRALLGVCALLMAANANAARPARKMGGGSRRWWKGRCGCEYAARLSGQERVLQPLDGGMQARRARRQRAAAARLGEESSDGDGRAEQPGWHSLPLPLPLSLPHSHASLARVFLCWIERASERASGADLCVWVRILAAAAREKAEESGHGHPTRGGCACCSLCLFGAISKSPMQRASQPVRQPDSQTASQPVNPSPAVEP
ncbi:hypothetical protein L1887_59573 [Cichorium endivia]|nr:hypothetical protein L1887_59573 [Cichorium endivia]